MQAQLEHYNRTAEDYTMARRNPCHRAYIEYLNAELYSCIVGNAKFGSRILDPMCGGGELITDLLERTQAEIDGIDLSVEMIKRIPQEIKIRAHIEVGDALAMNKVGKYDAIVISGGVHHVYRHIDRFFENVFIALKPGGTFACIEPCDDFPPFRIIRETMYRLHPAFDETEEHGLRSTTVLRKMREHGFKDVNGRPIGYLGYTVFGATDVLPWFGGIKNQALINAGIGLDRFWSHVPLFRYMSLLKIFTGTK
jgi:SAM-dependent methyltransferase